MVTNTCSAGRGLGKVSAAVTGGRRLLRCLVHLDCLDWNLLSHGATWGERGAREPVAPQGYRHSGPWESPPVLLWLHSTTLCCTGGGYTKAACGAETRDQNLLFPGIWTKKGLTGLPSSKSEEKATTAFA